jgi:hypothetical protein
MSTKNAPETAAEMMYTIALRDDQWDLIVLALCGIRDMTNGSVQYTVDQLARKFLRRRIDETVKAIQEVASEAGA